MAVEGTRARVHGGGQHVALQTQYQLAHTVVGLRTDVAKLLLKRLGRPRLQAPVLIVDEEAAILDAGRLADAVLLIVVDTLVGLVNGHIGKPVPGTDANGLADMQHAIGQTAGIGAGDIELVALSVDGVAFPRAAQLLMTIRTLNSGEDDFNTRLSSQSGPYARHPFNIICHHLRHVVHQRGVALLADDGRFGEVYGPSHRCTGHKNH